MKKALIIGSAPDAVRGQKLNDKVFDTIVVINNAWRVRSDWTHLVHPEDFALENRPVAQPGQTVISHREFVPANNAFGGVVYAGGTMAFTAAYWALKVLKPDIMAFLGCDMVYDDDAKTHFYGTGEADPLREDPTLQSLEAKSERLRWHALDTGCLCINLSERPTSRLTFDRVHFADLHHGLAEARENQLKALAERVSPDNLNDVLAAEKRAEQFVEDGAYWRAPKTLDWAKLAEIDRLWLSVFTPATAG